MTGFSVSDAASALLRARRDRQPLACSAQGPASKAEAFAVQDAVARELGRPGAWKVGGGGNAAPIAASLVRPSPCAWPANELLRTGIEAEIAFRIGRDLPGPAAPSPEQVRAAVASVHAVIEVVDSRFDTWPVPDPLWALADDQSNGGLVVEATGRPWRGEPLGRTHVRLTADGRTLFDREGVNPGGDPFELLVWLAGHAAARTGGLRAGDFVTTGSLTGVDFVEPGARVLAEIEGAGRVELTFAP